MSGPLDLTGQTLGHYRVVEKIGAGGMGVVYRAYDQQLDRDVALKVLPPGTLADDAARKQFRHEALALARVNHPNIATVFEFSTHGDIDFLAMELISGHSLQDLLQQGPLSQQEAVRLAVQLAEGLAAAHEQGLVHRDLKPANLFVTKDGRLKILDFGLARLVLPEPGADLTRSIKSDAGLLVGTLPYMSPEQLRGLPADARSDVYAAGAILYEMSAGSRPFPQNNGPELMGAILHTSPRSIRLVNPHVSSGFESVVAKSLEKEPSRRYQSAREFLSALEALASDSGSARSAASSISPRPVFSARGKALFALAAFAVALLVTAYFTTRSALRRASLPSPAPASGNVSHPPGAGNPPAGAPSSIHPRTSVAVLGFKNISGQSGKAWLSTALAEMLTTELGAGGTLRTVAGENVARMKASLSLPEADGYARETLARIRENLNADAVVVGSFVPLGQNQIRLDLRLQDTVVGETRASISEKGREDQIDDLVSRAGAELREKLGAGAIAPADAVAVRASLPANPEAARLYAEGLERLHARDALVARDLLQRSIALDPKFAQAHSALSSAWTSLGYDARAATEAKRAFDLSASLPREERLAIEALFRETSHDWPAAISVYQTLFQFFPDNLEYGLRLAAAHVSAGKAGDALTVLQSLRALPPPASADPRIDIEESSAYFFVNKWKEARDAAARAVAKARATGARLLLAEALVDQGIAHRFLNEFDKADVCYSEAESTYTAAGDRFGAATARMALATTAYQRGDLDHSRQLYQQSLSVFRELGSQKSIGVCLQDIAIIFYDQGKLTDALAMYQEALRTQREIDNRINIANSLNSIANVLADTGDQAGAKAKYQEALAIFREAGDQFSVAMLMGNIGELSLDQGNLSEAKQMLESALEIKRKLNNRHSQAYTLSTLGDLAYFQDDLPAARRYHQEALDLRTQLGEKSNAAQNVLALASLTLEAGKPADALEAARQAAQVFQSQKQVEYQALAGDLIARALLASGKLPEARQEIESSRRLLAGSVNHPARLAAAVTFGRILTASGDFAAARKTLSDALAEAQKANLAYYQLDARLALAQLQLKSSNASAARASLAALENEARASGFLLIARKARSATTGS